MCLASPWNAVTLVSHHVAGEGDRVGGMGGRQEWEDQGNASALLIEQLHIKVVIAF